MRRFILFTLLLSACNVKYYGLIVDKYYVTGEVDADSGYVRIQIINKYSKAPVNARITVNDQLLAQDSPGTYVGHVTGSPYRLNIETYDERASLVADSPGRTRLIGEFLGDTLRIHWSPAVNASFYRIVLSNGLDTLLADTSLEIQMEIDTMDYVLQIISGPSLENGRITPNFNNETWEIYFKILRKITGTISRP